MGTKACSTCPTTYAELYEQWRGKLATTIRGYDYPEEEVEDVMQELLTRFIEGDYLAVYRRDWVDPVTHKEKGAFSTFMYTFVKRRLLGWRDRRLKRLSRQPMLLADRLTSEGDTVSMELVDDSAWKSFAEVESSEDIALVLTNLRRMGTKGRSYAAIIYAMQKQLAGYEAKQVTVTRRGKNFKSTRYMRAEKEPEQKTPNLKDVKVNMVKLSQALHMSIPKLKVILAEMQQNQVIKDWHYEVDR